MYTCVCVYIYIYIYTHQTHNTQITNNYKQQSKHRQARPRVVRKLKHTKYIVTSRINSYTQVNNTQHISRVCYSTIYVISLY